MGISRFAEYCYGYYMNTIITVQYTGGMLDFIVPTYFRCEMCDCTCSTSIAECVVFPPIGAFIGSPQINFRGGEMRVAFLSPLRLQNNVPGMFYIPFSPPQDTPRLRTLLFVTAATRRTSRSFPTYSFLDVCTLSIPTCPNLRIHQECGISDGSKRFCMRPSRYVWCCRNSWFWAKYLIFGPNFSI